MGEAIFFIKRNDTLPALRIKLKDTGCLGKIQTFNLSSATGATFTMVDKSGNYKIFEQPSTITCFSGGTIQYNWQNGDTSENGIFKAEFQISFSGGTIMTVPQIGTINIEIGKNLNGL